MNELPATPTVNVQEGEYRRLLGLPPDFLVDDQIAELMRGAREWYAVHGRPWVSSIPLLDLRIEDVAVHVDGEVLKSRELVKRMREVGATGAVLVAASAGPEAEDEARRLWQAERPAEYFFLEIYASAVVENLVTMTGAALCGWAEQREEAVLPHYSPGYATWNVSDQHALMRLVRRDGVEALRGPLDVLESGMLSPKKSQLAFFALAPKANVPQSLIGAIPCEQCAFLACQYRRVPYAKRAYHNAARPGVNAYVARTHAPIPVPAAPKYAYNAKALRKWRETHLTLNFAEDGTADVGFRFDGSTCSNSGFPLAYRFGIKLGPREEGYKILDMTCVPWENDKGWLEQCSAKSNKDRMERMVTQDRPLIGKRWDEILKWDPTTEPAGCLCTPASRNHKWKIVVQTMHSALLEREKKLNEQADLDALAQ